MYSAFVKSVVLLGLMFLPLCRTGADKPQNAPKSLALPQVKPQGEEEPEDRWAVIIGVGSFKNPGIPSLRYASNDAEEMAATLEAHCGFARDHIKTLCDKAATAQNVRSVLGTWLPQVAKPGDVVVIYFSGHGTPDLDARVAEGGVRTFMVCYDTDPADLYGTAFPLDELAAVLPRVRSERALVLLDSCYSGAVPPLGAIGKPKTLHRDGVDTAGRLNNGYVQTLASAGRGRLVVTACDVTEQSYEYDQFKHGLFTHYLLQGLTGQAAETGKVTPLSLTSYIATNMTAPHAGLRPQTPVFLASFAGNGFTLSGNVHPVVQGNGTLSLTSSPLGARVIVDGKPVGTTPLKHSLSGGSHQVVLFKEGYLPYKHDVFVSSGRTTYESALLPLEENTGSLLVQAPPGARVKVEGREVGDMPAEGFLLLGNLEAKPLKLRVEAPQFAPYEETVSVPVGSLRTVRVMLKATLPGKREPVAGDVVAGLRQEGPRFVWAKDGVDMVFVSEGAFIMGADDSAETRPQQSVTLPAFWIDRTEVTNRQYAQFVRETGYQPTGGWKLQPANKDSLPAVHVTVADAKAYAHWAGKQLPTEAQWEKAARGTAGWLYPYGDTYAADAQLTRATSGNDEPVAVGSLLKGASPYGALDMLGNVAEWCDTIYDVYPGGTRSDPRFNKGQYVFRGGSFRTAPESEHLTVAKRSHLPPGNGQPDIGFRCVVVNP